MPHLSARLLYRIERLHSSIEDRADARELRITALNSIIEPALVKTAFDTRRTNQETDFNPRRNLQYYHRSEAFISEAAADQIKTLFKLKTAVDSIKEDFLGDPDWLDSYARILSVALDKTLRVEQKDMDFFQPQLDYLNELLYLRYRLKNDDIVRMSEKELKGAVLNKDEKLVFKNIYAKYNNNSIQKTTATNSNDQLIEKLFGEVKASKENKEVERSVTITINDKVV